MAVVNPCCCSLRTGTLVVAIFNICESLLFLIYHTINALLGVGVGLAVSGSRSSKTEYYDSRGNLQNRNPQDGDDDSMVAVATLVTLIFTILLLISIVVNMIFSILLLVGAKQGHIGKCWAWFVVTTIFLAFFIFYKVVMAVLMIVAAGIVAGLVIILIDIFFFLVFVLITCYQLWVVYAFVEELKTGCRAPGNGMEYPGVVYSVTPKQDDQPPSAPHFPQVDFGCPPPPYRATTYTDPMDNSSAEARPRHYNPASVGYPVLPVLKT